MGTVPQTVNCVDVLPGTSRHLQRYLLWTSLEPGHCHCAVCLMEPHMNISKPSVNKSNTGVRTLISHHKRRILVTLKILFFVEQENAWDFHCAEWDRETHRKCVSLTRDAWDLACLDMFNLGSSYFHVPLTTVRHLLNVTCSLRPPTLSQCHIDLRVWSYPRRVIYSRFHQNLFRGFWATGPRNLLLPITLSTGFYNQLVLLYKPWFRNFILCLSFIDCLQCFDAVGWVAGTASGL